MSTRFLNCSLLRVQLNRSSLPVIGSRLVGAMRNSTVDDFVAKRASKFQSVQSLSTTHCQTIPNKSAIFLKIQQISISARIGFGTRRSVVQIHSPRPLSNSCLVLK